MIVVGTGLEESMVAASAARNGHSVLHVDTNDYYGETWAAFNFDGIQKWIETRQKSDRGQNYADLQSDKNNESIFHAEKFKELLNENENLVEYSYNTIESDIKDVNQAWHTTEEQSIKETSTTSDQHHKSANDAHISTNSEKDPAELGDSKVLSGVNEELDNPVNQTESTKEEQISKKHRYFWNQEKIINCSRNFNLDLLPRLLFARGAMVELLISSNISRYTEFKVINTFSRTLR